MPAWQKKTSYIKYILHKIHSCDRKTIVKQFELKISIQMALTLFPAIQNPALHLFFFLIDQPPTAMQTQTSPPTELPGTVPDSV